MLQVATTTIELGRGLSAVIDAEDFERPIACHLTRGRIVTLVIAQQSWHACGDKWTYAFTNVRGSTSKVSMHRLIAGALPGQHADHINGDTLDNRRANLRVCSNRENLGNQQKRAGASRFKGVSPRPDGTFRAQICCDGRKMNLGNWPTEEDAARAYDVAARQHFGEFARLNFQD